MISLRTLLAGLVACLPRDEAQAARSVTHAETSTKAREPGAAPACVVDPLAEEAETLSLPG